MKKIIIGLASLLIATSLSAAWCPNAKVRSVGIMQNGAVVLGVTFNSGGNGGAFVNLTGDKLKLFVSTALTAKSTDSTVNVCLVSGKWVNITLK